MVLSTHEAHSLSKKQMVRIIVVVKVIEHLLYFRCFWAFSNILDLGPLYTFKKY